MKHANVAIFVPHVGCPQKCSFCDQWVISGEQKPPTPAQAREVIEQAAEKLSESSKSAQIAFFGGSFTAMSIEYMESLLQSVQKYIDNAIFTGIRISTRPDAINKEVLDILKSYHVTDIELGAQSMDDSVLQANLRGHTSEDIIAASKLIRAYGFGLGLQIMTGLYKDSIDITIHTASEIAKLKPDCVRIYPTVVLRHTMLAGLCETGEYRPQALDEAVGECADLLEFFTDKGIPVIRLGLHDSPGLTESIVAGPHHPAFRELCESRVLLRKALRDIEEKQIPEGNIILLVSPDSVSKMAGQKRENTRKLKRLGYDAKIVTDGEIGYLQVEVLRRV